MLLCLVDRESNSISVNTNNPKERAFLSAIKSQFGSYTFMKLDKNLEKYIDTGVSLKEYFDKSKDTFNGVMLCNGIEKYDNPVRLHSMALNLQAAGVALYLPRGGICQVNISGKSENARSYIGLSSVRRCVIPQMKPLSDVRNPSQNMNRLLLISRGGIFEKVSSEEFATYEAYWSRKQSFLFSEQNVKIDITPNMSGIQVAKCAELLSREIISHPKYEMDKTTVILDPKEDPAFNEALSVRFMNAGALIGVPERDEEDKYIGIRMLDTRDIYEQIYDIPNDIDFLPAVKPGEFPDAAEEKYDWNNEEYEYSAYNDEDIDIEGDDEIDDIDDYGSR